MDGLVSIIIPVYKAEKYLVRCVNSILSQTYQNWELLLIDDGSPDNSGMICDNYAASDKRIRVIHKSNGGVSSARQCGLNHALGEYLIHVDPDDWVEPKMIEILYATAKKENSDMVICDIYWDSTSSYVMKQRPAVLNSQGVLESFFDGTLHASCCNKLVRRLLFDKYNITFPLELSLYEDLFVNASLLLYNIKISYCPYAFYHYDICINANSVSKSYTESSYDYDLYVYNLFMNKFSNSVVCHKVKSAMSANMVQRAFYRSSFSSKEFRDKFFSFRYNFWDCNYLSRLEKIKYYFACIGFFGVFVMRRKLCLKLKYVK